MQVFIVEDSNSLRQRLSQIVSNIPNVEVIGSAGNADEAINRILGTPPDAIILDIRLNQSNGLQVLRAIKSAIPGSSIIILTNYPYPQYKKKFMDAGADYFFDKSTELDETIGVLRKLSHYYPGSRGPSLTRTRLSSSYDKSIKSQRYATPTHRV